MKKKYLLAAFLSSAAAGTAVQMNIFASEAVQEPIYAKETEEEELLFSDQYYIEEEPEPADITAEEIPAEDEGELETTESELSPAETEEEEILEIQEDAILDTAGADTSTGLKGVILSGASATIDLNTYTGDYVLIHTSSGTSTTDAAYTKYADTAVKSGILTGFIGVSRILCK